MKSDRDNIKNIFSSKLGSFEPELPPSLWEKIDADLNLNKEQSANIPNRVPIRKYIQWVGVAAAVVLAMLIFYPKQSEAEFGSLLATSYNKLNYDFMHEMKVAETKTAPSPESKTSNNNQTSRNLLALSTVSVHNKSRNTSQKINNVVEDVINETPLSPTQSTNKEEYINPEEITLLAEDINTSDIETELDKILTDTKDRYKKRDNFLALGPSIEAEPNKRIKKTDKSKKASNNFELGLAGSSGFSKANDTQLQLRHSNLYNITDDNQLSTPYKHQAVKLEHNQPISLGIGVTKELTNRISLESGIVYTQLYSKAKSMPGSEYKLRDSQRFHYLGIPLLINYKLIEWKRLNIYTSMGAMVEKDFAGRLNTTQSIIGMEDTRELIRSNISQDHPQFSLIGSLGVSYPIYNKLSLYSKFGIGYYLDAKNPYETIYSDRRWIFNLNFGIKFGI